VKRGEAGLTCDAEGVVLGGVRLAWADDDEDGAPKWRVRPRDEVADVLETAYGPQPSTVVDRCHRGLRRIAERFGAGDLALAGIEALMLRLPPINPDRMAKLAVTAFRRGGDAWQNEPRVPAGQTGGGQWTSGGGGSPSSQPEGSPGHASDHSESAGGGPNEITVTSSVPQARRQSGNGFYTNSSGGGVFYIPTVSGGQPLKPTEVHALDATAFQVGWGDGKIELKDAQGHVYQTGATPTELQSFNATTGRALGVSIYTHPDIPLGSPDSPPTAAEQRRLEAERAAWEAGVQASLDSPSGQATTFLGEAIVSLPFLALTPLEVGAAPKLWLNSVEGSWPRTESVVVTGGRAIDGGRSYQNSVVAIYPAVSKEALKFEALIDGEWLNGEADTVAEIFGQETGVEVKYVRGWSNSIYNPESSISSYRFAIAEQKETLLQARMYSKGFAGGAIYHTNSLEFASYYYRMFTKLGIDNIRFIITPATH
jgi:hypothetical protein